MTALLLLAAMWAAEPPGLLELIRQRVLSHLLHLPDYTCRLTVERSERPSSSRVMKLRDRLRLEVAYVGGKELYAWPGSGRFDEATSKELSGMDGSLSFGSFAMHARALFSSRHAVFTYTGTVEQDGRRLHRYEYKIARGHSRLQISDRVHEGAAGYHGYFLADAANLDLAELEIDTDDIPEEVQVLSSSERLTYQRVPIGDSHFLLPHTSELNMSSRAGLETHNQTLFEGCRQYQGTSVIRFDEPPPAPESASAAIPSGGPLPPGLDVEINLRPHITAETAIGEAVTGVVGYNVRQHGALLIPRGAEVAGRISRLETRRDRQGEYVVIGIRILTVSWEGHVHEFQGSLEDVGIEVGTSVRNRFYAPFASNPNSRWPWFRVTFAPPFPGEGVFCARGAPARITTPLRTVWRTGEGAAQP